MSPDALRTCQLNNGLTLRCLDRSRKIAADRWYVCVVIHIPIPVVASWLGSRIKDEDHLCQIRAVLGDEVLFQQQRERNFIAEDRKTAIVEQLCDSAVEMGKTYFGHPDFPGNFIAKAYREKMSRRW